MAANNLAWSQVFGRYLLLMLSAALASCSALQVDVDVYKGALLSQPEVQQRQYAYLAISARPLITEMKNEATKAEANCTNDGCRQQAGNVVKFLVSIDGHYDGSAASLKAAQRTDSAGKGIEAQTKDLSDAYKGGDKRLIAGKLAALNETLISFASQILFVVNHQTLYRDAASSGIAGFSDHRPVLQSLANTILLHANDLDRQAERNRQMDARAPVESLAIVQAFRVSPPVAFDNIRKALTRAPTQSASQPSGHGEGAVSPQRQSLMEKEKQAGTDATSLEAYLVGLKGLLATYRTLVAEPKGPAGSPVPSKTELKAAEQDRRAVAALYPAAAASDADRTEAGALAPLRAWLNRERSASVALERKERLALVLQHIESDKARLLAGAGDVANRSDLLAVFKSHLDQDQTLAQQQATDLRAALDKLRTEIKDLQRGVAREGREAEVAVAQAEKARRETTNAETVGKVLDQVREAVLKQADAARVADEGALHALLKSQLAQLQTGSSGQPTREQIDTTRQALANYRPVLGGLCGMADDKAKGAKDACSGERQINVVDALIASLRAQRVQALARGDRAAAEDLLEAINVAYEQRAAMIYLRPASDYLRSVHSASDLQEANEQQYRNMLNDWVRYVNPFNKKGDANESRRAELDKLYWQNVNRVTVGGGGFTNFVIAKDDIGNWYVKAYSSDPATILESATSLAMFNAGARLNVNLMQRYEMQKRLDASTDGVEKAALRGQMSDLNSQDGRPLLALRARYVKRYETSTRETAQDLLKQMLGLPGQVSAVVDANAAGKGDNCALADVKQGLSPLDGTYLAKPRDQLDQLLQQLGVNDDKLLEKIEQATQSALTATFQYAGRVFKAIDESQPASCDASWRRSVAQKARDVPRAHVLATATERRTAVERYDEALMNITDVATQR